MILRENQSADWAENRYGSTLGYPEQGPKPTGPDDQGMIEDKRENSEIGWELIRAMKTNQCAKSFGNLYSGAFLYAESNAPRFRRIGPAVVEI